MQAVIRAILCCCAALILPFNAKAQNLDGLKRLVPGIYVLDRQSTVAQLTILLLSSRSEEAFLKRLRTCADRNSTALALKDAGISVASVGEAPLRFMQANRCQIFVTRQFDFSALPGQQRRPSNNTDDVGRANPRPQAPETGPARPAEPAPTRPRDTTPPVITLADTNLRTKSRTGVVTARVVDPESPIRSVELRRANGQSQKMVRRSRATYSVEITLPEAFKSETVMVVANSDAPREARQRLSVARIPHCGPPIVVSRDLVESVQRNLICAGENPGNPDGLLGVRTCEGISDYLGDAYKTFNAGGLSWDRLNRRLAQTCAFSQPINLAFETPFVRDEDRVTVEIALSRYKDAARIVLSDEQGRGEARQNINGPERFTLIMPPPDREARYQVEVYDTQGKPRDKRTLVLRRPAPVLRVTPNGPINEDLAVVDVSAVMDVGASLTAFIEAQVAGVTRQSQRYDRGGTVLSVQMPKPGQEEVVTLMALTRAGKPLTRTQIVLKRPLPALPQPFAADKAPLFPDSLRAGATGKLDVLDRLTPIRVAQPGPLAAGQADQQPRADQTTPPPEPVLLTLEAVGGAVSSDAEVLLRIAIDNPGPTRRVVLLDQQSGTVLLDKVYTGDVVEDFVQMPNPGQSLVVTAHARNNEGTSLAMSQIALARMVAPAMPAWMWPAAGMATLLASGLLYFVRRKPPSAVPAQPPAAALVKPTVTVHPDETPQLKLPQGDLPAVIFWVDTSVPPSTSIHFPTEPEDKT